MKTIAIAIILMSACTDEASTRKLLEDEGYTNIETTGHDAFGCSNDDTSCTGFRATNPITHRRIKGVVGCGTHGCSKGCTLRIRP